MAKNATAKSRAQGSSNKKEAGERGTAIARAAQSASNDGKKQRFDAGDALIKLLQSPFVAELVAVAATAALAALAENGFTSSSDATRGKRAGKAVKAAGKAAAAAVGRRIGAEFDEIRKAGKSPIGA